MDLFASSQAWVIFFIILGVVNLYVAYNFSEDFWVNFKLFGMLGLTFTFIVVQGVYIARHSNETETGDEG